MYHVCKSNEAKPRHVYKDYFTVAQGNVFMAGQLLWWHWLRLLPWQWQLSVGHKCFTHFSLTCQLLPSLCFSTLTRDRLTVYDKGSPGIHDVTLTLNVIRWLLNEFLFKIWQSLSERLFVCTRISTITITQHQLSVVNKVCTNHSTIKEMFNYVYRFSQ